MLRDADAEPCVEGATVALGQKESIVAPFRPLPNKPHHVQSAARRGAAREGSNRNGPGRMLIEGQAAARLEGHAPGKQEPLLAARGGLRLDGGRQAARGAVGVPKPVAITFRLVPGDVDRG
jgi:hypothetical protein